jgi:restriction endonuclease S subunit
VPVGEVCTLEYGKPLDKEFRKLDGEFLAYGANGPISSASKYLIEGPCVIVGRKGSAGEITLVESNVWPLDVTYYIKHNPNVTDLRYLFYALKSLNIKQFVRGVKPGLNRNDVYELPIPLPSLQKQREIVAKLDSGFSEIDLLDSNLKLSDEKACQLMLSLLGAMFAPSVTLTDAGISALSKELDIKLVPLGDVCSVVNGGTPDTKVQEYWDGEHAWITPAEMGNLTSPYMANSRRKLSDLGLRNSSANLLPKHSVIMSSRAPIGHLVINQIPMASNQGCKGLIPNGDLDYRYLYYFLFASKEYLNALGTGTTFAEISGSKLKTVEIPLPTLDRQYEIIDKLDVVFESIGKIRNQIAIKKDFAIMLRKSLLSEAFSPSNEMASA